MFRIDSRNRTLVDETGKIIAMISTLTYWPFHYGRPRVQMDLDIVDVNGWTEHSESGPSEECQLEFTVAEPLLLEHKT